MWQGSSWQGASSARGLVSLASHGFPESFVTSLALAQDICMLFTACLDGSMWVCAHATTACMGGG